MGLRPEQSRTSHLLAQTAAALLLIPALVLVWRGFERLAALLVYPFPHDTLEGTLLYEARLIQAGEPLYQPLELYRFVSAPYPPLHPVLMALTDQIMGPHLFWGGRLISAASAVAVGVLLVVAGRLIGRSWLVGAIVGAVLISAPPFFLWGSRIKPDLFALWWILLGLLLASASLARGTSTTMGRWLLVAAASSYVCAFFTKQTAIAAPFATGLALLLTDVRHWRAGERAGFVGRVPVRWATVLFSTIYLASAFGTWALLDALTGGNYTLHVWWEGERTGWWSWGLMQKFVVLLAPYWPLMLLAVAAAVRGWHDPRARVVACYALVAPLTLFAAGETGANHNHLLETLLALTLAGVALAGWAATGTARPLARAAVFGGLALQLWLALLPPPAWYGSEIAPADPPERYVVFMANTPGEILADDPGLLLLAGKPIRYDDPSTQGPAVRLGAWDEAGMLDDIRNRRFSAIVIPVDVRIDTQDAAGRWTPAMLAAIREHYAVLFDDTLMVYTPR